MRMILRFVLSLLLSVTTVWATPSPVLWLDASALGLTDGTAISTFTDLSGNSYSPTAAGTARPTAKTNIQNGLAIARFNGTSNKMSWTGLGITTQPDTIIVVAKQTSKTTIGRFIDIQTGSRQLLGLNGGASGTGRLQIFAPTLVEGTVDRSGAFHVFTVIYNGASSTAYVDGALEINTSNPGSGALQSPTLWIGSDGTNFLTGDIGEIKVFNSALPADQRWDTENALLTKWGITAATPSPTSTPTATATATATATFTPTPSATVNCPVVCPTATFTPTATSTPTFTPTPSATVNCPVACPTATSTPSATSTATATATSTSTPTATATATATPLPVNLGRNRHP